MNIFKLPNVGRSMTERHDDDYKRQVSRYIRDKQRDDGVTVTEADLGPMVADTPLLGELVSKLVVDKPNWQFEVFHFYPSAHNNCIAYRCVNIKNQSGEVLGIVEAGTRYGRTGSVQTVEVYNNRISKERERSRGFSTKDVKAALRAINKQFYDKTTDELVREALSEASDAFSHTRHTFRVRVNKPKNELADLAVEYVIENDKEGFATFVDTKEKKLSGTTMNMIVDMVEAETHLRTIDEIMGLFKQERTALVIRNQGGYILRIDNDVKLCDDSSLPENIKPKLGMLKLVEKGQVISNTGCRVNEETFVVVLDATEQ
jgi:hypothetical protein